MALGGGRASEGILRGLAGDLSTAGNRFVQAPGVASKSAPVGFFISRVGRRSSSGLMFLRAVQAPCMFRRVLTGDSMLLRVTVDPFSARCAYKKRPKSLKNLQNLHKPSSGRAFRGIFKPPQNHPENSPKASTEYGFVEVLVEV